MAKLWVSGLALETLNCFLPAEDLPKPKPEG